VNNGFIVSLSKMWRCRACARNFKSWRVALNHEMSHGIPLNELRLYESKIVGVCKPFAKCYDTLTWTMPSFCE
jgi:hypothetical protein